MLDINLLRWFATKDDRSLEAVNAIVAARHVATNGEMRILAFLEQHIGGDSHEIHE